MTLESRAALEESALALKAMMDQAAVSVRVALPVMEQSAKVSVNIQTKHLVLSRAL